MREPIPPKVFISYSWSSEEHVDWVVELAKRLKSNGVQVILDQWQLKPGQDKYAFMEQMVTDPTVTKVLCICDQEYAEKANKRTGGVGTESQIISPEVYGKVDQEKFIPLIKERDSNGKEFLPVFFKPRIYFDFADPDQYEPSYQGLLRNIFGKPDRREPPLGQPPAHILEDDFESPKVLVEFARAKEAISKGKPIAHATMDEYFEAFVRSMDDFRLTVSNDPKFDEQIVDSIERFTGYRNTFIDLMLLVGQYLPDDEEAVERVASFFERLATFIEVPAIPGGHREDEVDNYRFMVYELVVYAIACLIKTRAYSAAAHLLEREYVMRLRFGDPQITNGGIARFNIYMEVLEEQRKRRLQLQHVTIAGDLVHERATHARVSFEDLKQADFVLFVHGAFANGRPIMWQPRCALYVRETLELFARAVTPAGAKALQTLLGISSIRQVVTALEDRQNAQTLTEMVRGYFLRGFSIATALNYEEIKRRT